MGELHEALRIAINTHCAENGSNTPDYVLAEMLVDVLTAFNDATRKRDAWYGVTLAPGMSRTPPPAADGAVVEAKKVAWLLSDEKINHLQVSTVSTIVQRAKQAHYCNVYLRINGRDELYEADWIKHMITPTQHTGNDTTEHGPSCEALQSSATPSGDDHG